MRDLDILRMMRPRGDKSIGFKTSENEIAKIDKVAAGLGVSRSVLLRYAIVKLMKEFESEEE